MSYEIACDEILKRIAELYGVGTDIDLAKKLGVASQTISTWRNRNKVPYDKVVELAAEKGVSLDFLIFGPEAVGKVGLVNAELMRYLFHGMDDELFLHERIANEPLGFDLLCRAYNSAIKNAQGADLDLSKPKMKAAADAAMKDVIDFYHEMFRFISGSMAERKEPGKAGNSSVNQTFHGSVGQAGGGDIHNYGDKDK